MMMKEGQGKRIASASANCVRHFSGAWGLRKGQPAHDISLRHSTQSIARPSPRPRTTIASHTRSPRCHPSNPNSNVPHRRPPLPSPPRRNRPIPRKRGRANKIATLRLPTTLPPSLLRLTDTMLHHMHRSLVPDPQRDLRTTRTPPSGEGSRPAKRESGAQL